MKTVTVLALTGFTVTLYSLLHLREWFGGDTYAALNTFRYMTAVLYLFGGLAIVGIRPLSR